MTRLVPTGAFANEAVAPTSSARGAVMLIALVVAIVAFAAVSLLARMFREAVSISMRLLGAALTAAAIAMIAVILIGTLLFGVSTQPAGAVGQATATLHQVT